MNAKLRKTYEAVRKASPVMLVGSNARCCLNIARTLVQWEVLRNAGLVRIEAESDPDPDFSYLDTWEHVSKPTKEQLLAKWADDTFVVFSQYRLSPSDRWESADSIGGCTGYADPCNPLENCYVADLMDNALTALRTALHARFCNHCRHRVA